MLKQRSDCLSAVIASESEVGYVGGCIPALEGIPRTATQQNPRTRIVDEISAHDIVVPGGSRTTTAIQVNTRACARKHTVRNHGIAVTAKIDSIAKFELTI